MNSIYILIRDLFFIMNLFLFFIFNINASESQNRPTIEITSKNTSIKVGEPLIVELKDIFNIPQLIEGTDEIQQERSSDVGTSFYIKNSKDEVSVFSTSIDYQCRDAKGLVYSSYIILFYDYKNNKLLFDIPGKYTITPFAEQDKLKERFGDKAPKPLIVDIKPSSEQEKKALSLLTGKDDLMILVRDDYITLPKEVLNRFKQVVEQCPDTMIAKMAAVRIGIELYSEYGKQKLYSNHDNQDSLTELRNEASKYLKIGTKLPEGFTIRENILHSLIAIEFYEKNYLQAISYLEKIYEEFPYGRFGKSALSGIEEVKEKMSNDPNWTNRKIAIEEEKEQSPKKPLGVALPIAGAAVAVIVIAGLVLFSRIKKLNKTK